MNNYISKNHSKIQLFQILSFLFLLFNVTKVFRGINTSSGVQGGVWNYISLIFYFFLVIGLSKNHLKICFTECCMVLYAVLADIVSLGYLTNINRDTLYTFLMIPYFAVVYSTFYLFADNDKSSMIFLDICFWICVCINIITIMRYRLGYYSRPFASDVYYSLGLLPFVLLHNKGIICKLAIIFTGVAIFFSGKRAGLIGFIIAVIIYYLIKSIEEKKNLIKFIIKICLIIVAFYMVYALSVFIDNRFDTGIYIRLSHLQDDGGSGRIEIYNELLQNFSRSSIGTKFFGHGMYSTNLLFRTLAHNDFLEVLYDYGIVSFIPFVLFYLGLFGKCLRLIKMHSPYAASFALSLIIGLSLSMFSFLLVYFTYSTCFSAFWGYCLKKEKIRNGDE